MHTQWTHVSKEFKNFYLLRDFKYSTDTFDGFELQGYETNIKEERVEFFNALKKSFLNYNFVQKHFTKIIENLYCEKRAVSLE